MTMTASPPAMARRRLARRFAAAAAAAAFACALARWRWRLSVGTGGHGTGPASASHGRGRGPGSAAGGRRGPLVALLGCPSSSRSSAARPSPTPSGSGRSPTTSPAPVAAATTSSPSSRPWARRPTSCSTSPHGCPTPGPGGRWTCSSRPVSARRWRWCRWRWPTLGCPAASFTGSQAGILTDTDPHQGAGSSTCGATASARRWRGAGRRSSAAPRACRPSAIITFLGGVAPIPRRWPSPTRSAPTPASSTPTCPACSRPTPASCPTPAGSPTSTSTKCSRCAASGCPKPEMRAVEFARTHGVRAPRPVELHVGARHVDHAGGRIMEQAIISAVVARRRRRSRSP